MYELDSILFFVAIYLPKHSSSASPGTATQTLPCPLIFPPPNEVEESLLLATPAYHVSDILTTTGIKDGSEADLIFS